MRLKVLLLALVVAISFAGVFTSTAKAEGPAVTPYANVLLWTGVTVTDKYSSGKTDDKGEATGDMDLVMGLTPQGSIGVRGGANNVNVDFAIMSRTPSPDTAEQGQTLMFIGVIMYNAGAVNVTIGRFFTNYDLLAFSDTACTGTAFGWDMMLSYALFDATRDQITVSANGFYVTLAKNAKNETATADVILPMVAAGYMYGNPGTPMNFSVHGLFQTYKMDDGAAPDTYGKSVSAYAVAGKFGMNMAPVSFFVTGYYGQNVGEMGFPTAPAAWDGDKIVNNVAMAFHGGVDYVMGAIKLGAGAGYKSNKYDVSGAKADTAMAYYVSLKYSIQPNFAVTPQILIQDNQKNAAEVKEGKVIAAGLLFEAHI